MAHIFVSPLSWGLGHATRTIPIIHEFLKHQHTVTIAADGRALVLLQQEFPACRFIPFADYPAPYSSSRYFLPKFIYSIPKIFAALGQERKRMAQLLQEAEYDLILSDNRFGAYSETIPSFFISHQLRFSVPPLMKPFEILTQYFNTFYHRKFTRVLVPDNIPAHGSLSGKLSQSQLSVTASKSYHVGILSSIRKLPGTADLDYLISLSGPEPQRTVLEQILLPQVHSLPGNKIILLGQPDADFTAHPDSQTTVRSHANREEMSVLMNRARFLICRSGYTTMMELAELEKTQALLIPTPGQTEQVYLSQYYQEKRWFHSQSQYRLNLLHDIEIAKTYKGFPLMPKTEENARRLYADVFSEFLNKLK